MNSKRINKVLVANRGEIAVRVIKTLRKLHIASVAIFADNDANALHRRMADEAYPLGNGPLKDTYLNVRKIIDAALDSGADAIHPGYGFLSESPELAEACQANNLIFIGPDADVMRLMGNKIEARKVAVKHGIPVTFGMMGSHDDILAQAETLPYPVLIKAAAGGGGKGMHIVWAKEDLQNELERASREAEKYFGDGTVFVEQYIENPRHIEVQVLADHFGHVIHLHERECTIQRRYQKIIEESPSPTLTEERRQQICDTAVKLCQAIGYRNAGTVEFLVDKDLNFYFLEMNTRIQVEHPVTEMRTGIDIVEEQIRIARGKEMGWTQDVIQPQGHAIELRIYAEDPANGFLPTPGKVTAYHEPQVRGARVDSSIDGTCTITEAYDPMIAKLTCHAKDRQSAIETARRALKEFIIQGLTTNKAYLWEVIKNEDFVENKIDTGFCATHQEALINALEESRNAQNVNDIVAAFSDSEILLYNMKEKPSERGSIKYGGEATSIFYCSEYLGYIAPDKKKENDTAYILHSYDLSGKKNFEYSFNMDYDKIYTAEDEIIISGGNQCLIIQSNGRKKFSYTFDGIVKSITPSSRRNEYMVTFENKTETIRLKTEDN